MIPWLDLHLSALGPIARQPGLDDAQAGGSVARPLAPDAVAA